MWGKNEGTKRENPTDLIITDKVVRTFLDASTFASGVNELRPSLVELAEKHKIIILRERE